MPRREGDSVTIQRGKKPYITRGIRGGRICDNTGRKGRSHRGCKIVDNTETMAEAIQNNGTQRAGSVSIRRGREEAIHNKRHQRGEGPRQYREEGQRQYREEGQKP